MDHKAAYLLRELVTAHIFNDGNHRTAYVTVKDFLQQNNANLHVHDYSDAGRFLKNIQAYNIDDIAEWIKHGSE